MVKSKLGVFMGMAMMGVALNGYSPDDCKISSGPESQPKRKPKKSSKPKKLKRRNKNAKNKRKRNRSRK